MEKPKAELLHGTLDMLVLNVLAGGKLHGYGIARELQRLSNEVLQIEQGSLYPALYRMEKRGYVEPQWGTSENNRRAKFYRLTAVGKKQLQAETSRWERMVEAVGRVMRSAPEEG